MELDLETQVQNLRKEEQVLLKKIDEENSRKSILCSCGNSQVDR